MPNLNQLISDSEHRAAYILVESIISVLRSLVHLLLRSFCFENLDFYNYLFTIVEAETVPNVDSLTWITPDRGVFADNANVQAHYWFIDRKKMNFNVYLSREFVPTIFDARFTLCSHVHKSKWQQTLCRIEKIIQCISDGSRSSTTTTTTKIPSKIK